jgi:hypothetical protein
LTTTAHKTVLDAMTRVWVAWGLAIAKVSLAAFCMGRRRGDALDAVRLNRWDRQSGVKAIAAART